MEKNKEKNRRSEIGSFEKITDTRIMPRRTREKRRKREREREMHVHVYPVKKPTRFQICVSAFATSLIISGKKFRRVHGFCMYLYLLPTLSVLYTLLGR